MRKKTLLRWWLFTSIILCAIVPLWVFEIFKDIYEADITSISFVIYGVFLLSMMISGLAAYRVSLGVNNQSYTEKTTKYVEVCWFLSETMMTLGLIGTVAGMIYLFGQIFIEIDPSNPEDLKAALSHMATGLSTAMYTTICGMVGALLSKVQLMNIEFDMDMSDGQKKI